MQTLKIFLSEITRPRALIFGMQHYLMVLYQSCSNYFPGVKIGPALGRLSLHSYIEKILKNLLVKNHKA